MELQNSEQFFKELSSKCSYANISLKGFWRQKSSSLPIQVFVRLCQEVGLRVSREAQRLVQEDLGKQISVSQLWERVQFWKKQEKELLQILRQSHNKFDFSKIRAVSQAQSKATGLRKAEHNIKEYKQKERRIERIRSLQIREQTLRDDKVLIEQLQQANQMFRSLSERFNFRVFKNSKSQLQISKYKENNLLENTSRQEFRRELKRLKKNYQRKFPVEVKSNALPELKPITVQKAKQERQQTFREILSNSKLIRSQLQKQLKMLKQGGICIRDLPISL